MRGEPDAWSGLTFQLHVEYPPAPWREQEKQLVEAGDVLHALSGFIIPLDANMQLVAHGSLAESNQPENIKTLESKSQALRATLSRTGVMLPSIQPIYLGGVLGNRAQPEALGWLNYWSAESCAYLGFPQPHRDEDLLERSYRTPAGAWLVKLTADPFDVSRDDHIRQLADVYERFPKLGIRRPSKALPLSTVPRDDAEDGSIGASGTLVVVNSADQASVGAVLQQIRKERISPAPAGGVNVKPGADGWSVIETEPAELLAEPGANGKPLLGELCQRLQVIGGLLTVRSPVDAILIESDARGHCRLSGGFVGATEQVNQFHGTPIDEANMHFAVLPFSFDLLDVDDYTQVLAEFRAEFAGR